MRKFLIISASEKNKIDYSQVPQEEDGLVYTLDGTKTFIKWDTEEDPTFVSSLEFKEGPYNIEEILNIINGPLWIDPS